jgi:hypothetical protein
VSSENPRRRERSAKDAPQVPRHVSKKNTRRWCKGKVGVEHRTEWVRKRETWASYGAGNHWYNLICKACGKHLDYCWMLGPNFTCKCGRHLTP